MNYFNKGGDYFERKIKNLFVARSNNTKAH